MPIDYNKIQGAELDSAKGKYGELLTQLEAEQHPAWLTALEGDKQLLKEYAGIVFQYKDPAMRFWQRTYIKEDQLRDLWVNDLSSYSNASAGNSLSSNARLLRVAPI